MSVLPISCPFQTAMTPLPLDSGGALSVAVYAMCHTLFSTSLR
jgi:hypothetical protein